MRTQTEIQANIKAIGDELEKLKAEEDKIESRLKKIIERKKVIYGPPNLIAQLRDELEVAIRYEEDADKPSIVFGETGYYDGDWVLSCITPKRIFIRQRGNKREDQFNRDGTSVCKWPRRRIDLKASGIPEEGGA